MEVRVPVARRHETQALEPRSDPLRRDEVLGGICQPSCHRVGREKEQVGLHVRLTDGGDLGRRLLRAKHGERGKRRKKDGGGKKSSHAAEDYQRLVTAGVAIVCLFRDNRADQLRAARTMFGISPRTRLACSCRSR